MRAVLLLILAVRGAQDDIPALIEKLRSLDIDVREEATTRLKELDEKAVTALEKALGDPDVDFRNRVQFLLKLRSVRQSLGDRILKRVPGLDERLAVGTSHVWVIVIQEAGDATGEQFKRYDKLEPDDRDRLLVAALRKVGDPEDKIAVLSRAKYARLHEIVPDCRRLLNDPDGNVRARSADNLGLLRDREAIPSLIRLLRDEYGSARASAASALADLKAKESIEPLLPLLKDPEAAARRSAVEALGWLMARERGAAILPLLADADAEVRGAALSSLGDLGVREAIPGVIEALKDREEDNRELAIRTLLQLGAVDAGSRILPCLEDESSSVRLRACLVLGQMRIKAATPAVLIRLKDPDGHVRLAAGRGLSLLGAGEVVADIRRLLKESDAGIHASACAALWESDATAAVPDLAALLSDPDSNVRREAVESLRLLRAKSEIERIRSLLKDSKGEVRGSAALALGQLESKDSIPDILALLEDPDPIVISFVAESLKTLRVGAALPQLRKLAMEKGRGGSEVIGAIARLGGREEAAVLLPILKEKDSSRVGAAIAALGEIGALEAVPELLRLSRETRPIPNWSKKAAMALCQLGRDEGVPLLLDDDGALARYLNQLNYLRQPEVARLMQGKTLSRERDDSLEDLPERVAKAAGLILERSPEAAPRLVYMWPMIRLLLREQEGQSSLWETFDLPFGVLGFHVVLEPGKLRVLSEEEALQFWRAWWKERQANKEK